MSDPCRLLLGVLRCDRPPDAWISELTRVRGDWDELVVTALVLGLGPLLHDRLTSEDSLRSIVPPLALAKLAVNRKAHAVRHAVIARQLSEVLVQARSRRIPVIALKGVVLAERVYRDPALRPMNDIDLLVEPEHLSALERVLESLGYRGKRRDPTVGPGVVKHTSTFLRDGAAPRTKNPYLSTAGECMIEPHQSLEERWFGLSVDITPGLFVRAVEVTLAGQPCLSLDPEDLLLHLVVHFSFNLIMGQPTMVQLADLPIVIERAPPDWSRFIDRAIERGAAAHAACALTLAKKLLGARVPEEVLSRLEQRTSRALRRRIPALDLEHVLRRTQQKPLNTLRDRLRRGFADRAEAARWAPGLRGRLRVWRTAVAFRRTDTWRRLWGSAGAGAP